MELPVNAIDSQDWAKKYRPKGLDDVIGQQGNISILKDRLLAPYQAMIFYGTSGCGKTTTARALANDLKAETIELDAAANNSVDDTRDIIEYVGRKAMSGSYKLVIIDEAHLLSKSAWNSLLKTVEEPPKKVVFIFCTTEYKALPETILGRAQLFKYYPLSNEELIQLYTYVAERENLHLSEDMVDRIIQATKNQARDFLKLLQKVSDTRITTEQQLDKLLSIPPMSMAGAFLQGVLSGDTKLAVTALKKIRTPLIEWVDRLMNLIYEIQEDKYGISELRYSIAQSTKLRKLGEDYRTREFGSVLNRLSRIKKESEAFAMLFTMALQGMDI